MESITLTIANEREAIPVLQAAAAVYVGAAGADSDIARQTELVIEEIFTNIIQHEYRPGQREKISVALAMVDDVLELLIRFQGIPFDIDYLRQCEQASLPEMVASGGRGLGIHLLGEFSDEVQYRNLGWKGQEILIRRLIRRDGGAAAARREESRQEEEAPAAPLRIAVRRMRPEEAATISKLAYFAYRYTYIKEHLYDPEEVRRRNEDGRMLSYVAVDEENGQLVGHMAMIPDELSDMPELGAGFVNPRYRKSGGFKTLNAYMIQDARQQGWQGIFGTAVTSHSYSQMSAAGTGMRESALLVSRVTPMAFQAITDQALSRESFLYMFLLFDPTPRKPYYPPPHHREIIEKICRHVNMAVSFRASPGEIALPVRGEMETKTDVYQAGHVVVHRWGGDTLSQVRTILRHWRLDRLETIYLYLPLSEPSTAVLCRSSEEMGFFFSGLMPGRAGEDWLVLQYLNNQRYDYGLIKSAYPFGQELIDYVRTCDPEGDL